MSETVERARLAVIECQRVAVEMKTWADSSTLPVMDDKVTVSEGGEVRYPWFAKEG